jgi:hypothetical protein
MATDFLAQTRVVKQPKLAPRHSSKYQNPKELKVRHWTAITAGSLFFVFAGLALSSALLGRPLLWLHFGTGLLVELALEFWPHCWVIASIHNAVLAVTSFAFFVAVTVGHADIPGDPNSSNIVVWRRTVPFVAHLWIFGAILAIAGLELQHRIELLAVLLEALASGMVLKALVATCIPIAREFLVVEIDPTFDGIGNKIVCGHGLKNWRRGNHVIFHDDILSVTHVRSFWLSCLNLATLRVHYCDASGTPRSLDVPALASIKLVEELAYYLSGKFRIARSRKALSLPIMHPLKSAAAQGAQPGPRKTDTT